METGYPADWGSLESKNKKTDLDLEVDSVCVVK
jgi:hypothetical protein